MQNVVILTFYRVTLTYIDVDICNVFYDGYLTQKATPVEWNDFQPDIKRCLYSVYVACTAPEPCFCRVLRHIGNKISFLFLFFPSHSASEPPKWNFNRECLYTVYVYSINIYILKYICMCMYVWDVV